MNNIQKVFAYKPSLNEQARVRLRRQSHAADLQPGVIVRVLENPSNRAKNQWYDVRFDSGVLGRFLERYLEPVTEGLDQQRESKGSQTFVA